MSIQAPTRTGFEKWQDGLARAVGDAKWNAYDCEVEMAVGEFNRHLGGTSGYRPLDWQLIKAMLWTESGAEHAEWKVKPMQIGVAGDPGLMALLSGKEGGELIIPPTWSGLLTAGSVRSMPSHNIRAGIAYLLMRMANFEHKSVAAEDGQIHEVTVKAGDSFDKIAKAQGTTIDVLKQLNPSGSVLRVGQVLKYKKASVRRVITGWRHINTASIAQRYNGGGDPNYAKKLDYALTLIRKGKAAACPQ
ncbi:lytic transglycosylase [Aquabacterium sp. A7-Y]|uniref:LysM peptidoglycan-binding domain-containing protein n=1 Tax=Aquabacterium sp. A7-Y TaxID=1349605 RepID=UPI00223D52E1|nr:LysM peptidoglycan-binding domain-containing protein [Aquabacterium sp. A7-Y]MCW7540458.1 lytic transglycosylase [Aquabacterium sp. A7-Y]